MNHDHIMLYCGGSYEKVRDGYRVSGAAQSEAKFRRHVPGGLTDRQLREAQQIPARGGEILSIQTADKKFQSNNLIDND